MYEPRTFRIIVQEELHPLKSLTNAETSVRPSLTLRVVCSVHAPRLPSTYPTVVHRRLYDKPGILHRDLSLHNIMCRIDTEGQQEQEVYGVLTDYDLSSWKEDLKGDYTRTSQRTGTPPYMTGELLQPRCTNHLYRRNVESLFYVMLLMCGPHAFSDAKDEQGTGRWLCARSRFRMSIGSNNVTELRNICSDQARFLSRRVDHPLVRTL